MSKRVEQTEIGERAIGELIGEENLDHLLDLLSPREQKVIELLAERDERMPKYLVIAEGLGVSEKRARAIMQRIHRKARTVADAHGLELKF